MNHTKEELDAVFGDNTIMITNNRTGEEVFIEDGLQTIHLRNGSEVDTVSGYGLIKTALKYYIEYGFKDAETYTVNGK